MCDNEANAAVPVPLSFLLSDILPKNDLLSPRADPPRGVESAPGAGRPSQIPRAGPGRLGRGQGRLWVARGRGVARARESPEKCLELSKTRRIWSFSGRAFYRRPTRESLPLLYSNFYWCQVREETLVPRVDKSIMGDSGPLAAQKSFSEYSVSSSPSVLISV